ncbi:hypothetical protein VKT23_004367 [Stygiomarasmius scandens]|uniref:Uncharacterized protein n=1 Tax=Marasmiellus scandens TaxID=2682957 RepID=A0ABR1JUQ6_9AGAR
MPFFGLFMTQFLDFHALKASVLSSIKYLLAVVFAIHTYVQSSRSRTGCTAASPPESNTLYVVSHLQLRQTPILFSSLLNPEFRIPSAPESSIYPATHSLNDIFFHSRRLSVLPA